MITRREFGTGVISMGVLVRNLGNGAVAKQESRNKTVMHVGSDYHSVLGDDIASKQNLEYNLRHGVRHLTAEIKNHAGGGWDLDELKRIRDNCEKYGVVLEAFRMDSGYITVAKGPERDHEIEITATNIRRAAQVGVK